MSPKRLVLFDIDGTILWGGPLWKECFLGAMAHFFPDLQFPKVSFGGKTDIQIAREMMAAMGLTQEQVEDHMHRVVDLYIERACVAAATRAHEVTVLPGAKAIIEELAQHPDVVLGLLTGNVRKGAHAKLTCARLVQHFKMGAYGDDHWDRYRLPQIAVDRALADLGHRFAGKQIVIIGDTIHDVNCGKSIGVRSIAVGTGRGIPTEDLLKQNPDFYFKDLSNTFEVTQAILEDI